MNTEVKNLVQVKNSILPLIEKAGELAISIREKGYELKEKTQADFVTEADLAVENFLTINLKEMFPDMSFLAEETANEFELKTHYVWCIDPIDGTANFMSNYPNGWAISVGLLKNNNNEEVDSYLAIVYLPDSKTYYYAVKNGGAYYVCNNIEQKLEVSKITELKKSLVTFGVNREANEFAYMAKILQEISPQVLGLRRAGAASIDFCFVARGITGVYVEHKIRTWDLAAGILVASEAGANVCTMTGDKIKLGPTSVLVGNPILHKQIFEIVKKYPFS